MKRIVSMDDFDGWLLSPEEHDLVKGRAGATRLGFALTIRFFDSHGRFPESSSDFTTAVVEIVANQIGVDDPSLFLSYRFSGRSFQAHRATIRQHFGFRESTSADVSRLGEWVATDVLPQQGLAESLAEVVLRQCRYLRIEPPSKGQIDRLIRSGRRQYEHHLCNNTLERLSPKHVAALTRIATSSKWVSIRESPGRASVESVFAEIEKLELLIRLDIPPTLFDSVPSREVKRWRDRAMSEGTSRLDAHSEPVRVTLLAALCWSRRREITDSLIDLLLVIVQKIGARAERRVTKELTKDLKRVTGKTNALFRLAQAALDKPDGKVSDVLFPVVSESTLKDLVREFKADGPGYRLRTQTYLRASYRSHYRQCLPKLLAAVVFESSNRTHRPVIEAVELLTRYVDRTEKLYPADETVPIEGVVPPGWREHVITKDSSGVSRINRVTYEIAVLQTLRDRLRCKEIWVHNAARWRNPDQDLPADFDDRYQAISKPINSSLFIADLRQRLTDRLDLLNKTLTDNPDGPVKISKTKGGWISVTPLDAVVEPANLAKIRTAVEQQWRGTGLLDMVKEADIRIGLTAGFDTTANRTILDLDILQRRLLLVLYALGTNTGIHRLAAGDHEETENDLRYVMKRYVNAPNLRRATTQVVDATLAERDNQIWGTATTCAADSTKFGSWDQNLLTEWHARYGGPGVMIYWHVAKRALCVYSQLKSCSSSEAAAAIEGVVRHATTMELDGYYVDTHGQTEVAFAVTELLGYQLLPRFKRIGSQRLYRPEPGTKHNWPALEPSLSRPINWDIIADQYDQMIRYATAIRIGTSDAESILRRFTRNSTSHPTYRAFSELGKVTKTIFLADYLQHRQLRREINEGLNIVENWNSVNGFIFYGKGGNIATNQRDQQEISMLALHLIQSCLVYVNTLMVQQTLNHPDWNTELTPEDKRGITPLFYRHVNPYGTFKLDMNKRIQLAN